MPSQERYHVAQALGTLADDRAVPLLIDWLRGDDFHLKNLALAALEHIDSELAAREARPLLKTEAHLPYKLRLARLLARHGFADGYALATEHLADADHTAAATLVLAALDDPRTADDLSEIVASMPDRRWYAATLTGLAATGSSDARTQLQNILANDRSPLAADAADAVGLVGDGQLLAPLAKLVQSRNKQIATSSLQALRRHLCDVRTSPRGLAAIELASADGDNGQSQPAGDIPEPARAEIAEAVASLASDAYVDADVRLESFHVARLLGGAPYTELLSELADQAELEGTPLLAAVRAQRRRGE
jgi:HEAT repeat protein